MFRLSSLQVYSKDQPSFEHLEERGWVHPEGLRGEPLESSLVKSFKDILIQVVKHQPFLRPEDTYTIIYFHHGADNGLKTILIGQGTPFSTGEIIEVLKWLGGELSNTENLEGGN